jgi:hypothetical protein
MTDLSTQPQAAQFALAESTVWWEDAAKFDLIQRVAKMFSSSPLVPKEYQGPSGIGSCVIAMNMANRMKADPLMVMQNLYIVHGRPSWSSQFLIACFNQTGRFAPIRYQFQGTAGSDDWGCTAISKDLRTGEDIQGPTITIAMAKKEGWYGKNGSKWQSIPELMLRYRAAGWLVRTIAPELTMGLQTEEESADIADASDFPSISVRPMSTSRAAAVAARLGKTVEPNPETEPEPDPDPESKGPDRFAELREQILKAKTTDQLVTASSEMQMDSGLLTNKQLKDLSGLLDSAAKALQS